MALVEQFGHTEGDTVFPPRGGFRAASYTSDRRKEFPDWPAWALAMLRVGSLTLSGDGLFVWSMVFEDTPEIRASLDKAPRDYVKDDIFRNGALVMQVSAGVAWALWEAALSIFAPRGAAGIPSDSVAGSEFDGKTAQELLDALRQAERDDARATQLARLKAFSFIGGHEVFPHIDPETADVVYTDSFPNLQAR